jgi:hypothetical protein
MTNKMTAQEIIQFIGNAEKKTAVKVTFEGAASGCKALKQVDPTGQCSCLVTGRKLRRSWLT